MITYLLMFYVSQLLLIYFNLKLNLNVIKKSDSVISYTEFVFGVKINTL